MRKKSVWFWNIGIKVSRQVRDFKMLFEMIGQLCDIEISLSSHFKLSPGATWKTLMSRKTLKMSYQNVDASHELYKITCLFPKLTHLTLKEWTSGKAETYVFIQSHICLLRGRI